MSDIQSYHVEWFVTRTVQSDVTVRIGGGRLLGVEPGRAVDAIDLGSVALVDGLVNAHTHLEFSGLKEPIPTSGRFTDWIRSVVAHRRAHPQSGTDSIRAGIRESLESGTTLIGEIATGGWSDSDYHSTPINRVIFQEVLGLSPERIAQQSALARSHVGVARSESSEIAARLDSRSIYGISPHAPYSTHLDLVQESIELAIKTGCPLAMHLAETRAELELLAYGTGEFREMLTDFGLWRPELLSRGTRPLDYLKLLSKAPRALIIHGNYLDDDELRFIAAHPSMTLVYCPRTHAAFGHSEHPWRRLIEHGGRVAFGTDSRASNPDLSLFRELQFLAQQYPDISHVELLQYASIEGRQALGFERDANADFTLIRLQESSMRNIEHHLFCSTSQVCGIMVDGEWSFVEPAYEFIRR